MQDRQRVLITGGGSGLGLALARAWAARGWKVAVGDVDADRARGACAELTTASDGIALELDVTRDADFRAAAAELERRWGGVDVVVNNAGVGSAGSVEITPMAEWQRVIDINLLGVARGCRTFVGAMRQRGSGHIVNIASFAAIANAPGMAAYNAAKAGVVSLSESLRHEVADDGIGVSVACPSFFRTNLVASMDGQSDEIKQLVHRLMDKSRVSADDVARDIVTAVERNRFMIISHTDVRWLHRVKRWLPNVFARLVRRQSRRFLSH